LKYSGFNATQMSNYSKRTKIRKQELKDEKIAAQNERLRQKALPKVLRKLETELSNYVGFMALFDGYLGEFTGQIVPVEPVGNPFVILHRMNLHFPHPNSINSEQKKMYINKIEDAFDRMGFMIRYSEKGNEDFFGGLLDASITRFYELLLFHITFLNEHDFDTFSSVNYEGVTLMVTRLNYEHLN